MAQGFTRTVSPSGLAVLLRRARVTEGHTERLGAVLDGTYRIQRRLDEGGMGLGRGGFHTVCCGDSTILRSELAGILEVSSSTNLALKGSSPPQAHVIALKTPSDPSCVLRPVTRAGVE